MVQMRTAAIDDSLLVPLVMTIEVPLVVGKEEPLSCGVSNDGTPRRPASAYSSWHIVRRSACPVLARDCTLQKRFVPNSRVSQFLESGLVPVPSMGCCMTRASEDVNSGECRDDSNRG